MGEAGTAVERCMTRGAEIIRQRGYRPLFVGVKGSVVYELPGTHTDVDVRVVYAASTADVLKIRRAPPRGRPDELEIVQAMEGELDLVGWEIAKFLRHLIGHNGNMIELVLTPEMYCWYGSDGHALRLLGTKLLTKRLHAYYKGYAEGQFKRAQSQIRTGKGAIYTYREMYAGIWLLRTGELLFPWAELRRKVEDEAALYRSGLIAEFDMDRERISDDILVRMRREFAELNEILDESLASSPLPEDHDALEEANTLLLALRSAGWTSGVSGEGEGESWTSGPTT